jgi:hypothetical protein
MPLFKVVQAIHSAGVGCLYVYIGDGGGPARSSSIRTRVTVAEVTGWRFTFSSWDPPNFSICWETHRKHGKVSRDVWELHSSMPLFKVVQAIHSAGVGVIGLDLRRTTIVYCQALPCLYYRMYYS